MNRLALALAVPWLGETVSLAPGKGVILLPMHGMAELGYCLNTHHLNGGDQTRVDAGMDENEGVENISVKYEQVKDKFRPTANPLQEISNTINNEIQEGHPTLRLTQEDLVIDTLAETVVTLDFSPSLVVNAVMSEELSEPLRLVDVSQLALYGKGVGDNSDQQKASEFRNQPTAAPTVSLHKIT